MYGNVTDTKRTATELSLVDKGASAQTSKELDIINQDLTIPMIENVAELLAMFKDGTDYVYTKEQGKDVEYTITNAIRQAQYEYVYEDRNAIENRKQKFDQVFSMMQAAGQNAQLFNMFDWKETYTTGFEMLGFDNPDKFFEDDTPADKFAQEIKQIPPELQGQAVGLRRPGNLPVGDGRRGQERLPPDGDEEPSRQGGHPRPGGPEGRGGEVPQDPGGIRNHQETAGDELTGRYWCFREKL